MEEIWRDIPGFEGYYQASTLGRIRSVARTVEYVKHYEDNHVVAKHHFPSRIRMPGITAGYRSLVLSIDGIHKDVLVHRLVALTFIPNPDNLPQVDHIDGNRDNNRVDNLRWVTPKDNIENAMTHGQHPVKISGKRRPIRDVYTREVYESMAAAEKKLGIPKGMISSGIRSGQRVHGHKFEVILSNQEV